MWKKVLIGIIVLIALVAIWSLFLTRGLPEIADKQLAAIKQGDIKTAYSYTAKDFQINVSLKNFEKFINQHPAMKNDQKIGWGKRSFSGNIGTLNGSLISDDGVITPIEYHFVKENNAWKILSIIFNKAEIQLAPPVEQTPIEKKIIDNYNQNKIYQVLISDIQGPNKNIEKTKSLISVSAPKIYASVYILNAKAGTKINIKMLQADNGTIVGTNTAKITHNGNVIRNFSFTNADKTWPTGVYQINVTTSNQQSATVNFNIE